MTIANILSRTRYNPSKHKTVLLALLLVTPRMLGLAARDAQQRQVNNKILYDLMKAIFALMPAWGTPDLRCNPPMKMSNYYFFLPLSLWIADHLKNVNL